MVRLPARALILLAGLAVAVMPVTPVTATAVRDQGRTDSVVGRGAGRRVLLVTTDTSVRAPATVRAGTVTFELVNRGHEVHIGSMVRLTGGKTLADFRRLLRNPPPQAPPWIHDVPFGGFSPLSPGHRVGIVADFQATGTYVYFCLLTTPDGVPHALAGELTSFRVVAPETRERRPQADATIVATDTGFVVPVLRPGHHLLRLVNHDQQPHEYAILQPRHHASFEEIDQWLQGGQVGPAPVTFYGGVQDVPAGASALLDIRLAAGRYVLADGETGIATTLRVRG